MKRQQFPHGPDMIGDPGGHRWCYRLPSLAQTGLSRAKVIGRPDHIPRMVEREGVTRQSPAAAGERGQALPKRRVEPLHVCRIDHTVPLRPTSECLVVCHINPVLARMALS